MTSHAEPQHPMAPVPWLGRTARFCTRGLLCLSCGVLVVAGYAWAGRHTASEPVLLPLTPVDRAIPLVPATVWIYHSLVAFITYAWFTVPTVRLARRLMLGTLVCTAVSMVFFVYLPTARYPVELTGGDAISRRALEVLWVIDSPANCLPSLHVALATVVGLTLREYRSGRLAIGWAIAISIATLTTKQHYAVDVLAGALLGWIAHAIVAWAARADRRPWWSLGTSPIRLVDAKDRAQLDKVKPRDWRLDDLPALASNRALSPDMVRFLNQVIYVEHIAAINFEFLARAAKDDPQLRETYARFADEERRHAEGLRRVLAANGATIEAPGLGCAMLLHQFDALDPDCDADAVLVALSIPVFETFLDAGTIPFVRKHETIASPGLDELVANICRDEARHLAVNWAVSRASVRALRGKRLAGLRLACNPKIIRSGLATPFLAMDVYAHARRLGFDFRRLLPSFRRLWQLHRGFPELRSFPIWLGFRVWIAVAATVTVGVIAIDRVAPRLLAWAARFVPRVTDRVAAGLYGDRLLERRGLPLPGDRGREEGAAWRSAA